MEAKDFTYQSLLSSGGVYQEFYKATYRGLGHAEDGVDFTTTCPSGHENNVRVTADRIQKSESGKNVITGEMPKKCVSCGATLRKSWVVATKTESASSFAEWLGR